MGTLGGSSGVLNSFACYVLRACLLVTWWERRPCGLRLLRQASWWKFYGDWQREGKVRGASGKSSGDGAGARVAVLEDHETAILEVERQVELLEKRVRDCDTFAAVVDTVRTRLQETQKVVAELATMLDKSDRDLRKQLDRTFTELEDDLELRVDEVAKSVRDGSNEIQVLARAVKNLEQWGDEVAYRYLRPLEDRVKHLEQCWS